MALCFISHFNRASITSAGDEHIMAQFGITEIRMGAVYSAFLLVYTLFMIPGGWGVDRWGPHRALLGMGVGSALFCGFTGGIGLGVVSSGQVWGALLVVRSLMGMLGAPLHPAAARSVGAWFSERERSLANGLITGASILAYAVVYPVFGGLVDRVGWPQAFIFAGGITLAMALVWGFVGSDRPRTQGGPDPGAGSSASTPAVTPRPGMLRRRGLVWLTLSYATVGYFQYIFFYWLHYYFSDVLHMGKEESRVSAGFPSLAMAACMPLGGWLTSLAERRFGVAAGRSLVPGIGMCLSAVALLAAISTHDRVLVVLWFTAALGALGLCESAFWTTAVEIGGARAGTAAAVMNTGGNALGLLAPIFTPGISRLLGWHFGLGLGALVAIGGAACWIWIWRALERHRS